MSYENDLHIGMLNDYWNKIQKLEQELQKTREQLNTCEKLLMRFVPDEKTIQWQQRELDAKQYFKDKQGE